MPGFGNSGFGGVWVLKSIYVILKKSPRHRKSEVRLKSGIEFLYQANHIQNGMYLVKYTGEPFVQRIWS